MDDWALRDTAEPAGRKQGGSTLLTVIADKADQDLYSEALSVITIHTDSGGLCRGCMDFAARPSWWPCLQVEWARAAVAALEAESAPR
jgi:hypothetical protein